MSSAQLHAPGKVLVHQSHRPSAAHLTGFDQRLKYQHNRKHLPSRGGLIMAILAGGYGVGALGAVLLTKGIAIAGFVIPPVLGGA